MGSNALSPKQERFCLNLFQGMSQREAYVQAGYSARQSPASLDVRACELAAVSKVAVRLDKLKAEAKTTSSMTVEQRQDKLAEIANTEFKTPPSAKEVTQAIAELNKMDGAYAPAQVEHTGPGGGPIQIVGFQFVATVTEDTPGSPG